ncbi:MAG: class I SAM-dependent methyltransferase [Proteobacteria bacterium]|nr:class I SAM-dependent methyltransferase [Pseudomonadota bacterium]
MRPDRTPPAVEGAPVKQRWYDGPLYAWFYDPVEADKRAQIAAWIPPGASVVDLASGTGALAFALAENGRRVLGLDISPRMHAWCRRRQEKLNLSGLSFVLGDATRATECLNQTYDYAVASLLIHELPETERTAVLAEAGRAASRIILSDFAAPPPSNFRGLANHWMEFFIGGRENFRVYREYQAGGGLPGVLSRAGMPILDRKTDRHGACEFILTRAA